MKLQFRTWERARVESSRFWRALCRCWVGRKCAPLLGVAPLRAYANDRLLLPQALAAICLVVATCAGCGQVQIEPATTGAGTDTGGPISQDGSSDLVTGVDSLPGETVAESGA